MLFGTVLEQNETNYGLEFSWELFFGEWILIEIS